MSTELERRKVGLAPRKVRAACRRVAALCSVFVLVTAPLSTYPGWLALLGLMHLSLVLFTRGEYSLRWALTGKKEDR